MIRAIKLCKKNEKCIVIIKRTKRLLRTINKIRRANATVPVRIWEIINHYMDLQCKRHLQEKENNCMRLSRVVMKNACLDSFNDTE